MKRFFLISLLLMPFIAQISAQNCNDIVLPHVGYNQAALDMMPAAKVQWHCQYSHNSFFQTNEVPAGALVFDLSSLVAVLDGSHPQANMAIDLTTLSYYAYNFYDFQKQDFNNTVYFRTPGASYQYLAVRSVGETFQRTDYPEKFAE